jgi:hypothetical protein
MPGQTPWIHRAPQNTGLFTPLLSPWSPAAPDSLARLASPGCVQTPGPVDHPGAPQRRSE